MFIHPQQRPLRPVHIRPLIIDGEAELGSVDPELCLYDVCQLSPVQSVRTSGGRYGLGFIRVFCSTTVVTIKVMRTIYYYLFLGNCMVVTVCHSNSSPTNTNNALEKCSCLQCASLGRGLHEEV